MMQTEITSSSCERIMADWHCTELEARVALKHACDSLDNTIKTIRKAITHNRLLSALMPSSIDYMRNDLLKGEKVSESYIMAKAEELTKQEAYMFSYEWEQLDGYETMDAEEIERVVFGTKEKATV